MDKQMIEEMAREFGDEVYKCGYTSSCKSCILGGDCQPYLYAKVAYNVGYRKIPENEVVLTNERYDELFASARRSKIKTIDLESIVKTRKETAEKFAERLKTECFDGGIDDKWVTVSFSRLDEICKEITGEN